MNQPASEAQGLSKPQSQSQEGKTKHGERAGWGISASVKLCAQPFQERAPAHCGSLPHPRGRPSRRRLHLASQSIRQAEGARCFLAKETPLLLRASPLRFPRARAGRASQGFSQGAGRGWDERREGFEASPSLAAKSSNRPTSLGVAHFQVREPIGDFPRPQSG